MNPSPLQTALSASKPLPASAGEERRLQTALDARPCLPASQAEECAALLRELPSRRVSVADHGRFHTWIQTGVGTDRDADLADGGAASQ